MIRHAIGQDTFKNGITNYLNKLRYRNANHTDLWNALNDQAKRDGESVNVGDVMDTWTLQMNYPVVMVARQGQNLTLKQQRFLKDPTAKDPEKFISPFGYTWEIPFTFTTSAQRDFNETKANITWMKRNAPQVTIQLQASLPADGWVLGNVKEVGYYRVNYDDDNWHRLSQQLTSDHTVIDPVNRAQIINDAWNLAGGGYLNQSIALSVVEYLDKEEDYVPWTAASAELGYVKTMLATTELLGAFKTFLADKTKGQYRKLGMNNSEASFQESFTRALIVSIACANDVDDCVNESKRLFSEWKTTDKNPIAPELRSTVYCTAIRHGSTEDWDFLYDKFQKEANVNEKNRQMYRLACSREQWILSRLLNRAMFSGDIRSQDALGIVQYVAQNPAGRSVAWQFIRDSWDTIFDRYNEDIFALSNLLGSLGRLFNSPIQLQEMEAFVQSHPDLGTGARASQAALESVRSNIRWMDNNYAIVQQWLATLGYYKA
nr:hypothetical protein BaRGS_013442 [Batillaria attramentaria]